MSDGGPLARALLALELIQNHPGITAERLGERLEVSGRAARRYVNLLRDAGIQIDATRGPYGGYRIGRGIRLPPLAFTGAEALALVMAVLDGHHDTRDPTTPVGAALSKILRALPAAVAAEAELVRRATEPAPDRTAARPDAATTAALVQAGAAQRRVRISYRSESGTEWTTDVQPWAVVVRHARWYLLCHDDGAGARRAYRVDRIRQVDVLEDTFTRPAGLDAVAVLEAHLAEGWEHAVEVIIDAPPDTVARWITPALGQLEPRGEHGSRLSGTTSNPRWYAEQLASVRAPYSITRPAELQSAARAIGTRLLAAASAP